MKKLLLFVICVLIGFYAHAQSSAQEEVDNQIETPKQRGDFWVALSADGSFYSQNGIAYGGGLSLGYGTGTSIGIKAAYFFSTEKIDTLEINIFLRFYIFGMKAYSGPFLQLIGGPVFFNNHGVFSIPSMLGSFSGGAVFGWRFLIKDRWFVEPAIRAGYPFFIGVAVSAGIRH